MAETDDVICNTLGTFVGATSLLLAHAMEKHKERPTTMTLTATETQFLHIAKTAVSGGELPTEAVDWPAIFTLANQQKLLPILFETVRKTPAAGENAPLFAAIKRQVIGQVLNQTVRSAEFTDLYRKLRAAGLHPVVVKGQLCSRLYPLRDQRISADDDLFIPEGEFFVCHEALLANGLTTDTPADELPTADEVSYTKKDSPLYIELHRHLFDSAEDAHDELNHFFVDIAPVEVDGFLTMPPHEHLLYLILHAYKHFVYSGIACGSSATSASGRRRTTIRSTGSACMTSAPASTRRPSPLRPSGLPGRIWASTLICPRRGTTTWMRSRCCTTLSAAACTAPTATPACTRPP